MMQVIPKWKVTVTFQTGSAVVVFVSERHVGNVLRTVSSMDFSDNALEQPMRICVELQQ